MAVISWLNHNGGAVTVLATLALVALTAVYVVLTGRIARASRESVSVTEHASQRQEALAEAELVRTLTQEYSQPKMAEALKLLETWQRDNAETATAADEWAVIMNYERAEEASPAQLEAENLDQARRMVAHWHLKITQLVRHGYVSDRFVALFRTWGAWPLVLTVVRELDRAHQQAWRGSTQLAMGLYDDMERYFGRT